MTYHPGSDLLEGSAMDVLKQVGVVTPPTNVALKASSVSRAWLTVFTGTFLHMIGK